MGIVMLRELFHPSAYLLIEPRVYYVQQYQKSVFRVWPDDFIGFPNRTYQIFGGAAAKIQKTLFATYLYELCSFHVITSRKPDTFS